MKPCMDCGILAQDHRCPQHLAEWKARREARFPRKRASAHKRGYTAAWNEIRRRVLADQPWCSYCQATADLTVDHRVPLALGGTSTYANAQTLCRKCNSMKGGDVDAVWRLSRVSDDVYQLTCEMNRFYINETSKKLSIERRINPVLRHVVSDAALARALHARVTAALECLQSHGIDPGLGARKAREEMIRIGQTHSEASVRDAQAERRKNLGIVRESDAG